jgi:bile acid:Na+ symporter, BASS family
MILQVLAWLGRNGTALMAAGIVLGLAVPPLSHILAPTLPPLIFLITVTTMLRIDWPQVVRHARRPHRIALVVAWSLLLTPIVVTLVVRGLDLPRGLAQAMVLWAASPPMMSLPAVAYLLGLDGALALVVMVTGTLLVPLTLPPLVLGLTGIDTGLGVLPLMARLALFVGASVLVASGLGRLIGPDRLRRHATELNGFNVLLLLVFAVAVMDGMWHRIAEGPGRVLLFALSAIVAAIVMQAVSFAAFAWLDRQSQLTVALIGGNKNMAIVWANLASAASPDLMLYFACLQLPIYLLPAALAPIYRRLGTRAAA